MTKYKGPVTLRDVAVEFSKAEWKLLTPAQKSLYKNVMLETFSNLFSVGYRVVKPSVIAKLKKGKEPWPLEEFFRKSRGGELEKNHVARDPLKDLLKKKKAGHGGTHL